MAFAQATPYLTLLANGTVAQFRCVKAGATEGDFDVIAASTDVCLGVLQDDPADNEAGLIQYTGICKAKAGAAIADGAQVMSAADGDIITFVGAAGNYVLGIALENAAADQDVISILLRPGQPTS